MSKNTCFEQAFLRSENPGYPGKRFLPCSDYHFTINLLLKKKALLNIEYIYRYI